MACLFREIASDIDKFAIGTDLPLALKGEK